MVSPVTPAPSESLFDHAGFWAVLAAIPAVTGGIFLGVGIAEFAKPKARTDLWSYGWFRFGITLEVFAYLARELGNHSLCCTGTPQGTRVGMEE